MFLGVVLGILTLFVFLVNGGVGLGLLRLWRSEERRVGKECQ